MSLDLPQLVPQLEAAGEEAADLARRRSELLPRARRALERAGAIPPADLKQRLTQAGDRWPGARPTAENPAARVAAPAPPTALRVLAADGSQIYPDHHAATAYYLINIGSIQLDHGSGRAPIIDSQPSLYFRTADLDREPNGTISVALINGKRDVAEMGELARLAQSEAPDPTLALLDNGLLLWLVLQVSGREEAEVDELLDRYLDHFAELRAAGALLAGVLDQPRHRNVLALAHLAELPFEALTPEALTSDPFRELTDHALFHDLLKVGERSAVFRHGSPAAVRYQQAGHGLHFFYLKSSPRTTLRIELPEWVVAEEGNLAAVHAGVLADAKATEGYPYTLARAHELAVIGQQERDQLQQLLGAAVRRHGLPARRSAKSALKSWSGRQRRHRL